MPLPFTVVVADFLDEAGVETSVLEDFARVVVARARRTRTRCGPFVGEKPTPCSSSMTSPWSASRPSPRPRAASASSERGWVSTTWTWRPRTDTGSSSATSRITARRRWPTTRSCSSSPLARRLIQVASTPSDDGGWHYETVVGAPRLRGKTLGLVGCGRIGSATAMRARALGLDVVFYDPLVKHGTDKCSGSAGAHSLEDLLGAEPFRQRALLPRRDDAPPDRRPRPGGDAAGFVPDQHREGPDRRPAGARGGALDSGRPGRRAALDVVEREPLDDERLRSHPRVILTPHSAFYSVEGYLELRTKAAEEVRRVLQGHSPWNPVNRPVEARR